MLSIYLSMLETEEEKNLFEQLYIKYKQDMYAVVYDVLKNKEDAEDAVHQSFLKIADNFTKVSQISCHEIKAYIVIICRNMALNMYRQNQNRAKHSAVLNKNEIVDESYFENQNYDEILRAIKQLPQMYKDVIYLYYLQEFSAKEAASQLGMSSDLVRLRALRAKKMLKEILERSSHNNTQFKRAISEALTDEYELSVPAHNNDHEFSDQFIRKMDKLIDRQKKPYYKMINTFGKRATCIVAVIFLASFTTIMSVSALRNAFKDFFMSIFSDRSEISATIDSNEAAPDTIQNNYDISYDLSDYDVIFEEYDKSSRNIIYQKEDKIIDYQQLVKTNFDIGLNTENAEISSIDISGHDAVYYVDNHNYYHLIWDNGEYIIMISSNIGRNELIDIANSVQKAEK